jgi:predicted nucleic acid-binding protein
VRVFYLDTSAAIKLIRQEKETASLVRWQKDMAGEPHQFVSSDVIRTELMHAATRWGVPAAEVQPLINSLTLLRVTSAVCESAGRLSGLGLRSVDAIHLASAMLLSGSLESIVTYDKRMLDAAQHLGLSAISPA